MKWNSLLLIVLCLAGCGDQQPPHAAAPARAALVADQPKPDRSVLGLRVGDRIAFEQRGDGSFHINLLPRNGKCPRISSIDDRAIVVQMSDTKDRKVTIPIERISVVMQ